VTQQVVLLFVITCGVGVAMLLQGISKNALERSTFRCPNCARPVKHGHACDCMRRS
jgi:hypothetical protein